MRDVPTAEQKLINPGLMTGWLQPALTQSHLMLRWRRGHIICWFVATEEHVLFSVSMHARLWVFVTCVSKNALLVSDSEQNIYCWGPLKLWVSLVTWYLLFFCSNLISKEERLWRNIFKQIHLCRRNLNSQPCLDFAGFLAEILHAHFKEAAEGMFCCEGNAVGWKEISLQKLCILQNK